MTHDDSFDDFPTDHDDHLADETAIQGDIPVDDHAVEESHDWDSFDEPSVKGGKDAKKKKTEKIIIGGALAVGLVIVVLKMGGGHARQPASTMPPAPVQTAATPAPAPATPITPEKAAPALPPTRDDIIYGRTGQNTNTDTATLQPAPSAGFLNDPAALKKIEAIQAAHVPAAVPETNSDQENHVPTLTLKETAKAPPMPAPIASAPPAAAPIISIPASDTQPGMPSPIKPVITAPPVQSVTAMPSTTGGVDTATGNQLKEITTQLSTIAAQLQDLQANSVRKTELTDLQTQVTALKNRLDQQPAAATVATSTVPTSAIPKTSHATARKITRHHTVAQPLPMDTGSNDNTQWTLKSAQPGTAIVDSGDGQLVTVQTGDHLKGLGTVKSITQQDGQWVVKGSTGKITQ